MDNENKMFNEYLDSTELSVNSKSQYRWSFNKFATLKKGLLNSTENEIISFIKKMVDKNGEQPKPKSKLSHLNIAIMFRKHNDLPNKLLLKYKQELIGENQKHKSKKNDIKKLSLPNVEEVIAHEKKLLETGDMRGFIIVHLLRILHCRNLDLDMLITTDRSSLNNEDNFALVQDKKLTLIRNNYKTKKMYGTKKKIITSKKLIGIFKAFLNEEKEKYLLAKEDNTHLTESSIQKFICKHTLDNLNESDMNRVFCTDALERNDFKYLQQIEKERGTSLITLMSEYSTQFPQ